MPLQQLAVQHLLRPIQLQALEGMWLPQLALLSMSRRSLTKL